MSNEPDTQTPNTPDANVSRVERFLGRAVLRIVGVMLLGAAVVALVAPFQPNITYDLTVVRLALAAMLLTLLAIWWLGRKERRPALLRKLHCPATLMRHPLAWSILLTVAGSVACVIVALNLEYAFGWDAGIVRAIGHRALTDQKLSPYLSSYLSMYSNNFPLVIVDAACEEVARAWGWDLPTPFVFLNGLCLAVSVQSVYAVVRLVRGIGAAMVAQLVTLVLLGLSPWMTVPYTDILSTPFPILAIALVLTASRSRSRARWGECGALAVLALAVGYVLKSTPAVVFLALGVMVLLVSLGGYGGRAALLRRVVAAFALLASGAAVFLGSASLLHETAVEASGVDLTRVDTSRTPPLVWWVAMGTKSGTGPNARFGGYDGRMVVATRVMTPAEDKAYSTRLLQSRLSRYGPWGYTEFVAKKYAWNWGDGMFWAYGEGTDAKRPVVAHGPITEWVKTWNNPQGKRYLVRADVTEALWLLLIGLGGLGLLRHPYHRDVLLLALSALGIALFTVIFQGHSRYLIVYLPIVIALAVAVRPLGRRRSGQVSRPWLDLSTVAALASSSRKPLYTIQDPP